MPKYPRVTLLLRGCNRPSLVDNRPYNGESSQGVYREIVGHNSGYPRTPRNLHNHYLPYYEVQQTHAHLGYAHPATPYTYSSSGPYLSPALNSEYSRTPSNPHNHYLPYYEVQQTQIHLGYAHPATPYTYSSSGPYLSPDNQTTSAPSASPIPPLPPLPPCPQAPRMKHRQIPGKSSANRVGKNTSVIGHGQNPSINLDKKNIDKLMNALVLVDETTLVRGSPFLTRNADLIITDHTRWDKQAQMQNAWKPRLVYWHRE